MTTPAPTKNLRDTLLDALKTLPGTREFHIHVLETIPRKNTSLYQFAKPRPKAYVQDVLVLLSEQVGEDKDKDKAQARILVSAIEGNLYVVPGTGSGILYVCKVDSTGQSSAPSPTRTLVKAFLKYYADPRSRPIKGTKNLWIQLFARAQGQYLFPNSAMWEGKKPLSDVRLCGWWKKVLGQVALELTTGNSGTNVQVQGYYVLPGYGELEAEYSLKVGADEGGIGWTYGHPYKTELGLPCPADTQRKNLGHYIPYFDDDPKSRFLEEIAYTSGVEIKSPAKKRARTETGRADREEDKGKEEKDKVLGELGKVTAEEFWERMSFRQECVAGAVTGFFCVVVSSGSMDGESLDIETLQGQVSPQVIKRVLTAMTTGVEFSTVARARQATETLESTMKGLCSGAAYSGAVYGSVSVSNGGVGVSTERPSTVRVLTARKKRKGI